MGGLFSKPKIPEAKVQAPPIENPVLEPEAPELGAEETEEITERSLREKG